VCSEKQRVREVGGSGGAEASCASLYRLVCNETWRRGTTRSVAHARESKRENKNVCPFGWERGREDAGGVNFGRVGQSRRGCGGLPVKKVLTRVGDALGGGKHHR